MSIPGDKFIYLGSKGVIGKVRITRRSPTLPVVQLLTRIIHGAEGFDKLHSTELMIIDTLYENAWLIEHHLKELC